MHLQKLQGTVRLLSATSSRQRRAGISLTLGSGLPQSIFRLDRHVPFQKHFESGAVSSLGSPVNRRNKCELQSYNIWYNEGQRFGQASD